jgi:hypothetical protein
MGKQLSILEIKATLGQLNFYKSEDGFLVRRKSGLDKTKILTDSSFQRTRENMSEFAGAAHAGKLLRESVISLMTLAKDSKVTSRLQKSLMLILKGDTASIRGQRKVQNGDVTLLTGFNFNRHAKLSVVFNPPYTTAVDRVAGTLSVSIPSFQPDLMIAAPEGATHFKIVSAGSEVDFVNNTSVTDLQSSAILPWDSTPTTLIALSSSVSAGSVQPLFIHLGVQFFEQINSNYYPLKNNAYNPLGIVKVDQV